MEIPRHTAGMPTDPWKSLKKARTAANLSRVRLGELAGCSEQMIVHLENGTRKRSLKWANAFAPHLQTTPEALLFDRDDGEIKVLGPAPNIQDWPRDLPVRGTAAGANGDEGAMQIDMAGVIDHIRRPVGLAEAKDAYAIYVVGDSMEPRHYEGDPVFVHPHRPPRPGDDVIVQVRRSEHGPTEAFLKRLVRKSSAEIVLEQFNPQRQITIKTAEVSAIHRVSPWKELLGF